MSTTTDLPRLRDHTLELRNRQLSHALMRLLSAQRALRARGLPATLRAAAARYPDDPDLRRAFEAYQGFVQRSAVSPGHTFDPDQSALAALKPLTDGFLAVVRPQTILGRLPGVRTVPFNVGVAVQTSPSVASWAGEDHVKPIGQEAFSAVSLTIAAISNIITVSAELAALVSPGSETTLERDLAAGVVQFSDEQFIDPANVGLANVKPASITAGIVALPPSGTTAAALVKDVDTLLAAFDANNRNAKASLLMTPGTARMLARAAIIQTLTQDGGHYFGAPVYTSASVGAVIVALDEEQILVADAGITLDASGEASPQMNNAPDDPALASSTVTSLWQNNLVGIRAERFITWKRARTSAVQYLSPCAYQPGT